MSTAGSKASRATSHTPPQLQGIDTDMDLPIDIRHSSVSYIYDLPDPARDPALFANVMLGIEWIEDIEVQALFLHQLSSGTEGAPSRTYCKDVTTPRFSGTLLKWRQQRR